MYSVKKFNKGEILRQFGTGENIVGWTAPRTVFAIINPEGLVHLTTNRLTGKKSPEIFSLKSAAQKEADYYNGLTS